MVSKRKIEEAIVSESVMRMANRIREHMTANEDECFPPGFPECIKDMVRHAAPVALALIRITELSRWN